MTPAISPREWRGRAERLARDLMAAGKLRSPKWRAAIQEVPRHVFTPDVFDRDTDGNWLRLDTSTQQGMGVWLDRVYSNTALLTAQSPSLDRALRSSSSMPGLMTRMLESLDVRDDHRILEIGTGTGYNAGLLSQRLGDDQVFSVDIEPDLVESARKRLASLGYHPTLRVGDGADGLAECAPFDRIIATCAVPIIPEAWIDQTRPGGVILTDLKISRGAGSLVRLTRTDDGAQGRFDPVYAAFMDIRTRHTAAPQPARQRSTNDRSHTPRRRTSTLDPHTPWNALLVWFLASLDLGSEVRTGYRRPDDSGHPTVSSITLADGSWSEVTLAEHGGQHDVIEGGPRSVWRVVEAAHERWLTLGEPGWDRLGLTVTREGQTIWIDSPSSAHAWRIDRHRPR